MNKDAQTVLEALEFYYGHEDEGYHEWVRRCQNDCGATAKQALPAAQRLVEGEKVTERESGSGK